MKVFNYLCGDSEMSIPVPESYADCYKLAQSDYYRYTGERATFFQMLKRRGRFRLNFWLRMSSYRGPAYLICNAMLKRVSSDIKVDIRPATKIGYGFSWDRDAGFVIDESAVIGNNVHVGPRVHIADKVMVGDNVAIWADSNVTDNVPRNAVVAGSPAKVVSYRMQKS